MLKMIFTGIKRRRKEIRYVSVVTFVAVLFMTGITLFQNIMNSYVFHKNLYTYGDWVVSSVGRELEHPYFSKGSNCVSGGSLVDENGMPNMIIAGKAEDAFYSLYGELLYEGYMPMNENEIAMDIASLASLGYSYETGQTIAINYMDKDGKIAHEEYVLTGVLKNFANIWRSSEGYSLPNMFVVESEFDQYIAEPYVTYFYQLDPQYENIDTSEFVKSFITGEEQQMSNPVTYNVYVYENRLWGAQEVFDKMTIAFMLIAVLAISYLLISYMGKRRPVYYRYRCIGASKLQVRMMIFAECVCSTIPQVVLGTGLSYGIAWITGKILEQKYEIGEVYEFQWTLLGEQLGTVLGVILLAIFIAQLSVSEKRLAGNTGEIKPRKYKWLRRIAKRVQRPESSLWKRLHVIRPLPGFASAVFSFVVCGCLVFCTYKISYSVHDTLRHLEISKDMTLWYEELEEYRFQKEELEADGFIHVYSDSYHPAGLSLGADELFMEAVRRTPGIESVKICWEDEVHYLKWEGMENSPLLKFLSECSAFDTPLMYKTEMEFYDETALEEIQEEFELLYETEEVDWEAVQKGEEVIIIYRDTWRVLDESGYDTDEILEIEENTLHRGDTVSITHFQEDYVTKVKVAAICKIPEDVYSSFSPNSLLVIGSKELAEEIVKTEGNELKYNSIEIMYDNNSSYESTDKQLTALAVANGMGYSSSAEYRREYIKQTIQDISVYGSLFLLVLVVYIVLQNSFLVGKNKYRKQCYITLKRIGMEDRQYLKYSIWDEAKQFLWILPGIFLGYIMIGYGEYKFQMSFAAEYELDQSGEWVIENVVIPHLKYISEVPLVVIPLVAVTLFIYIVMMINAVAAIKKSLQEDK